MTYRHNLRNEVIVLKALLKLACSELLRRCIELPPILAKWYQAQVELTRLRKPRPASVKSELTVDRVQQLMKEGIDFSDFS